MRIFPAAIFALALCAAPPAAGASIAYKQAEDVWGLLLPVIAILAVVGVVAAAIVFGAKRLGYPVSLPGAGRKLRLLERLPLSRHCTLLLVEYEGRAILLGQSADRLTEIGTRAAPPPADAP